MTEWPIWAMTGAGNSQTEAKTATANPKTIVFFMIDLLNVYLLSGIILFDLAESSFFRHHDPKKQSGKQGQSGAVAERNQRPVDLAKNVPEEAGYRRGRERRQANGGVVKAKSGRPRL